MNRTRWSVLLASLLALSLSGCMTVGPDHKIPDEAKINDNNALKPFESANEDAFKANNAPDKWWQLYDDPLLNQLIEKALKNNTDLRIAAANLAKARAVIEEVEMGRIPQVDVYTNPKFGRNASGQNGSKNPRYADRWMNDTGINISYQVDLFGKITRGIEAATAQKDAVLAAYDLTRITVAADTAKAYADACSSAYRRDIAINSAKIQAKFLTTTKQLTRAGRGTALDVSRASAQHEAIVATIPPLVAQNKLALYRLSVLTGELPTNIDEKVKQCNKLPQLKQPIPVGDGALLLRRRPDIRQAEREMASASARIGVATADLYPNITFGIGGGMTGWFSQFGDSNTFRFGIGPLISWTIPNTSTARARIKQAEAEHQAAFAHFDGVVLNALRETESALTTYARELDRNAALKRARDQSALANRQSNDLYRHGKIDFMSKLDSERTYVIDQAAYAASAAKLIDDQITLFLALGGGWEQTTDTKENKQ